MGKTASLRTKTGSPTRDVFYFSFEGRDIPAIAGDTVAAALWVEGIRELRSSPSAGTPRGAFCFMGSCQECVVETDDGVIEACRLRAVPGLAVWKKGGRHVEG